MVCQDHALSLGRETQQSTKQQKWEKENVSLEESPITQTYKWNRAGSDIAFVGKRSKNKHIEPTDLILDNVFSLENLSLKNNQ